MFTRISIAILCLGWFVVPSRAEEPQKYKPNFCDTNVTDAGLKELNDLKKLTALSLILTTVTDAGVKELKNLKNLTSLNLGGTKVTEAGANELRQALPSCFIWR